MEKINVPEGKKLVASFTTWQNRIIEYEIESYMVNDIVSCVQGQYTFVNNEKHFGIRGETFAKVDIFLANKDYVLKGDKNENIQNKK